MFNKTLLLATLVATAASPAYANHEALQKAQELNQVLDTTAREAREVSIEAGRRGQQVRAQRFQALAQDARILAREVQTQIVRGLRQGQRIHIVRQNFQALEHNFDQLQSSASVIAAMPQDIAYLLRESQQLRRQLGRILRSIGGGGGGHGLLTAVCEVVLETIWGSDLERFYGRAVGHNPQQLIIAAEQQAMSQCVARRTGLTKCTVARNTCGIQGV